jgi:hypothetical protein
MPGPYRITAAVEDLDRTVTTTVGPGSTAVVELALTRPPEPVYQSAPRSARELPALRRNRPRTRPRPAPPPSASIPSASRPLEEPPQEYVVVRPPTRRTPMFDVRSGFVDTLVAASSGL